MKARARLIFGGCIRGRRKILQSRVKKNVKVRNGVNNPVINGDEIRRTFAWAGEIGVKIIQNSLSCKQWIFFVANYGCAMVTWLI